MKHFTGEMQREFIIPFHPLQVYRGIHYYDGARLRFTLISFKKAGAKFEQDEDGKWKLVSPTGKKLETMFRNLEKIYRQKIIESEKKHDQKNMKKNRESAESNLLIKDAMKLWLKASKSNKSKQTVKEFYTVTVDRYLGAVENHALNKISDEHIIQFKDSLKINHKKSVAKKPNETSLASRNIRLRQLRVFLNWAHKTKNSEGKRYLDEVPEVPLFPTIEKLPELYSEDEVQKLINHLDNLLSTNPIGLKRNPDKRQKRFILLHKRILYLLLGTGFRRSEVLYLEWNQIDFESGLITLKSKPEFGFSVKEGKESIRPILPNALEFLQTQRELYPDEIYVLDANGQPAYKKPHTITIAFQRYRNDLDLNPKAKAVHSLRAFFASLAEHAGIDPFTIQQMMGHSSIETTKIYLGRPTKRIQKAMNTMHEESNRFFPGNK